MKKPVMLLCLIAFAAMFSTIYAAPPAASQSQNDEIPREVIAWIESEVAKSETPPVADLHSALEFFGNEKNARLIGYIKGYDPSLGFSSGTIKYYNSIMDESLISMIEIEPDGRFTSDVGLASPSCPNVVINNWDIDLYLEPGQTLGVILDWDDFLELDRKRDWKLSLRPISYYGPLAIVNKEFNEYKIQFWTEQSKITDPWEFKKHQLECWKSQSDSLDMIVRTKNISPKSADILRSRIINKNVLLLLDFIYSMESKNMDHKEVMRRIDSIKCNGYYDFLRTDFMNDPALLIPYESNHTVNRYEYADHPMSITNKLRENVPEKTFIEYLTGDLGIVLSSEESDHLNYDIVAKLESLETEDEQEAHLAEYNKKGTELLGKYESYFSDYQIKYPTPVPHSELELSKMELRLRDSSMKSMFLLQPNLVQDIVKMHDLKNIIDYWLSKEEARELATYAAFGFANPFMVMWSERIYNEKFPSGGVADEPYELPQGKATDIFKRIIDPLRGKIIMVDFWGTTCGPCVMAIRDSKRVREEYNDDRMAFVYITDESWSPDATAYDKFVAENFMPHTYRLSNDESNYLSQLFGISGRPHYIIISPDGRVAVKRYPFSFGKKQLDELISKYFPAEENMDSHRSGRRRH